MFWGFISTAPITNSTPKQLKIQSWTKTFTLMFALVDLTSLQITPKVPILVLQSWLSVTPTRLLRPSVATQHQVETRTPVNGHTLCVIKSANIQQSRHQTVERPTWSELARYMSADRNPEPLLLYWTLNLSHYFLRRNSTGQLHIETNILVQ